MEWELLSLNSLVVFALAQPPDEPPMRLLTLTPAAALLTAFVIVPAVKAQSISPSSLTETLALGTSITIDKTITLGSSGANLVDLFFLADNTGSMGSIIANTQAGASTILGGLPNGVDYNFGVGSYLGDPSEGEPNAYMQNAAMSPMASDAQAGIDSWFASGGGDLPEANFYALQQAANTTDWRTGSQRVMVWFGDAYSHTETTTQSDAIAALQSEGITVVAFNSLGAGDGIDALGQASAVASATGGSLTNDFLSLSSSQFNTAVNSAISTATSSLDLVFGSTLASSGLSLSFVCTDILGCNDVGGGETRTFSMTITANTVGTYDFSVFANGVAATELDHITVVDSMSPVPEPTTVALMATGLIGVAGIAHRRRKKSQLA